MAVKDRAKLDINNELNEESMQLIHYFAEDTTDKILQHIDRLNVKDTGTLRSTIRSTVYYNAGSHSALASFYFAYYAPFVEQAVGKYWGVDNDLGAGVGVKSVNINAEPIQSVGYGPLGATFSGVPSNKRREATHRPRPFIMSEIRRQVERISYRLLEVCSNTIQIHMLNTIDDALMPDTPGNYWRKEGYRTLTRDFRPNFGNGIGVISLV